MAQDEKTGRKKIANDNITMLRECLPQKYESIKKKEHKLRKVLSFNSKNLTVINSLMSRTGVTDPFFIKNEFHSEGNQIERLHHLRDRLKFILDYVNSNIPTEYRGHLLQGSLDMSKIFSYEEVLKSMLTNPADWSESHKTISNDFSMA